MPAEAGKQAEMEKDLAGGGSAPSWAFCAVTDPL